MGTLRQFDRPPGWLSSRPPRRPLTAVAGLALGLAALEAGVAACSEPASLACTPSGPAVAVVDNSGPGRWSRDGRRPRLTEEWRASLGPLGDGIPAIRVPQLRSVSPDGTVELYDLAAGLVLEAGVRADPIVTRPLPGALISSLSGAGMKQDPATGRRGDALALPSGGVLVVRSPQPIEGGAPDRLVSFVIRALPGGGVPDTVYAASVQVLFASSQELIRLEDEMRHGSIPDVAEGDRFGNWPRPGSTFPVTAVGPGGAIGLGGASAAYRIDVMRTDLSDSLVVCRRAPALPLTTSENGLVELPGSPPGLAAMLGSSRKVRPLMAFGRIFFGTEGRLWVQRERPDPQRLYAHPEGAAYDVFEAGGEYLGEVRAPDGSLLFGDGGGLVYGVETVDGPEVFLVAYSLE